MMNVLWRGTFGDYLMELWNPDSTARDTRLLKTPALYALRRYCRRAICGPTGALAAAARRQAAVRDPAHCRQTLRRARGSAVESGIGKLLGVLRPMWELASRKRAD